MGDPTIETKPLCACGHDCFAHFRGEGYCFACRVEIPDVEARVAWDFEVDGGANPYPGEPGKCSHFEGRRDA